MRPLRVAFPVPLNICKGMYFMNKICKGVVFKIKGAIFTGGQSLEIRIQALEFMFCNFLKTLRYSHLKRFSNSKMQNFLRQSNQGGLSKLLINF